MTTAQIEREWTEGKLREQKRQHRHNRRIRKMQMQKAKAENKVSGKFMNRVVVADIIAALIFTVVMIHVYMVTGSEPSTLIDNVFRFLSVEGGAMALIKVSKTYAKTKSDATTDTATDELNERTAETEE